MTGTVKFFDEGKGFGFIKQDNGDGDIFVHASGLVGLNWLQEGDKVAYEVSKSDRDNRLKAINVTLLDN